MSSLKICRSSPRQWPPALAPIISTPYFSSTPPRSSAIAVFNAVCPPSVGSRTSLPLRAKPLHFLDFARDDFFDAFRRDGFDVGPVGELRVRHDGGRIRIDQDDAVTFLLQRLAGLRARIIKFTRLPDDDRAGADDQNGVNVGALRHSSKILIYDW